MGKKRKHEANNDDFEFDPIPRHLVTSHIKKQEKRLIVILENAHLETVKVSTHGLLHFYGTFSVLYSVMVI